MVGCTDSTNLHFAEVVGCSQAVLNLSDSQGRHTELVGDRSVGIFGTLFSGFLLGLLL